MERRQGLNRWTLRMERNVSEWTSCVSGERKRGWIIENLLPACLPSLVISENAASVHPSFCSCCFPLARNVLAGDSFIYKQRKPSDSVSQSGASRSQWSAVNCFNVRIRCLSLSSPTAILFVSVSTWYLTLLFFSWQLFPFHILLPHQCPVTTCLSQVILSCHTQSVCTQNVQPSPSV